MKKVLLWIMLIILILLLSSLIYIKHTNDNNYNNDNKVTWYSYIKWTFDEEGNEIDVDKQCEDYKIEISNKKIIICQKEECKEYKYKKEDYRYILLDNNNKEITDNNIELYYGDTGVQMTKHLSKNSKATEDYFFRQG